MHDNQKDTNSNDSIPLGQREDSTFTPEDITELKLLGISKPALLAKHRWEAPLMLSQRHLDLISQVSQGKSMEELEHSSGYSQDKLDRFLASPSFMQYVHKHYTDKNDPRKKLDSLGMQAVDTLQEVMENPEEKGNVRLAAATYVIDQAVGKAKQELSIQNTTIIQVMQRIEQLSSRPVSELSNLLAPKQDSMDAVIDDIVAESIVVGRRSNGEEDGEDI